MVESDWATEEMASARLADKRLDKRLTQVLFALSERPNASIAAACGGRNETMAAYRLFENPKVDYKKVMASHETMTLQRVKQQKQVLFVQDTTELNVTRPEQQVVGAGPMDSGARRGAFLHLMEAFTPDGTPLGAAWSEVWARKEPDLSQTRAQRKYANVSKPIEKKESFRWLQGLRQTRSIAEQAPGVHCICIGDSEADIFQLFQEPRGNGNMDWLFRGCQERNTEDGEGQVTGKLPAELLVNPVLFTHEIDVRSRKSLIASDKSARRVTRKGRKAKMEVRAKRVTLCAPLYTEFPSVDVNVVWVRETNPPAGEEPIDWILLTTLPIDTLEQVNEIIQHYTVRWMIEVFFRVLKFGCRVESRRFEYLDRLLPCVAIYMIVAWRTLYLVRLGRSCPDINCEAAFEPSEWKSIWMVSFKQPPPAIPPRLSEMLRLIGQLGGFIYTNSGSDVPGPHTTLLGLQRMHDFAIAWDTFGPGAKSAR